MLEERGIFVMGTDTGVGKTVVTAAIALAAQVQGRDPAVLKPAQTGDDGAITGDAEFVAALIGLDEPPDAICPYRLRAALAPAVAAGLEGARLDPRVVVDAYNDLAARHDLVLVEAAGGALVPFSDGVEHGGAGRPAAPAGGGGRAPGAGDAEPHPADARGAPPPRPDGARGGGQRHAGRARSRPPHQPAGPGAPDPGAAAGRHPLRPRDRRRARQRRAPRQIGPAGLDPLLGGTFSLARFAATTRPGSRP